MIYDSIQSMMGNTPLLKINIDKKNVNFYVKMESLNPTGSIKDRACLYNILDAIKKGHLTKNKTILDASSGNMACALAFYGNILGYKVKVICNDKLTQDKKDFIEYFGGELEIFGSITFEGNRKCYEMSITEQGQKEYCFLDQLHNPCNPQASFETLGPEIYADLPTVNAIVGSMGSGGSMLGISRYFKQKNNAVQIFTSQASSGTKIPGTGAFVDGDYKTPFIYELEEKELVDDTFLINMEQAKLGTQFLALRGVFAGYQAGCVYEAAIQAIEKHDITGNVVMIIGDSGWKNMEKLKK